MYGSFVSVLCAKKGDVAPKVPIVAMHNYVIDSAKPPSRECR